MKIWKTISLAFIGVFSVALATISVPKSISEVKGLEQDTIDSPATDSLLIDYDDFSDMRSGEIDHKLLTTDRGHQLNYHTNYESGIVSLDDKVTTKFTGADENAYKSPDFNIYYYPGMEINKITITVPKQNNNSQSAVLTIGSRFTSTAAEAPLELLYLYNGSKVINCDEVYGNKGIVSPSFYFDRDSCYIVSIRIDFIRAAYRSLYSEFNHESIYDTYDEVSYLCYVYGFPKETKFSLVPRAGGGTFDVNYNHTKFYYDEGILRIMFYIGGIPGRLEWDIIADLPSGNQMKFAEHYDNVLDKQISAIPSYNYGEYFTECTYYFDAVVPPYFGDSGGYNPFDLEWKLSDPSAFTTTIEDQRIKLIPNKVGTYTLQLIANFRLSNIDALSNIITLDVKDIKENPNVNKKYTVTDIDNGVPIAPGKSTVHGIVYAYHIYDKQNKYLEFILTNPLDGKGILVRTKMVHSEEDSYRNQYLVFKNCTIACLPSGDIYLESPSVLFGGYGPWKTNKINYGLFDRNVKNAAFDIVTLNGVDVPGSNNTQLKYDTNFNDKFDSDPKKMMTIKYFNNPYSPSSSAFMQVNDPDLLPGDTVSPAIQEARNNMNELGTPPKTDQPSLTINKIRLAQTISMPLSNTRTIPVWQLGTCDILTERFYNELQKPANQITRSCLESYAVVKDMYYHFTMNDQFAFQNTGKEEVHPAYDRYLAWARANGDDDPFNTNSQSTNNPLGYKDEHYILLVGGIIVMAAFGAASILIIKKHRQKRS